MTEHDHQAALFKWAEISKKQYPELGLMFAIPMGGDRRASVGAKLKREGVKAGVPDIFLPVPRNNLHGLFIELKKPKDETPAGRPTKLQLEWLENLSGYGYAAIVCTGWEAAKETIEAYLQYDLYAGREGDK